MHNPKGWVTVDFGDVRMIDGKIEVSKFSREEDVKNVQQEGEEGGCMTSE